MVGFSGILINFLMHLPMRCFVPSLLKFSDLCNLPFINTELLEPRQRIEKCQSFIEKLGIDDGFRGWYARVVVPGRINVGDSIALVA